LWKSLSIVIDAAEANWHPISRREIIFNNMKKLILFSIAALVFLSACEPVGEDMPPSEHTLAYLALGDSYTIGQSVPEAQRWPVQLVVKLREAGVPIADPVIIARTGWTTAELMRAIDDQYSDGVYDLVSVLVGVNDQYRGYPIDEYRAEFREMLGFALSAVGGEPARVIVLSIPDWGVTPFADGLNNTEIAAEIDAFNAVAREESAAAGIQYFDITPISRQAPQNPALIAGDGLHPSGEMYAAWVEVVYPYVFELLSAEQ
jgi:acyl-CoA thioesterase-1